VEGVWVDKHVGRSHVIAEDLEGTSVIDAVLWDELLEPSTSYEALSNIGLVVGEIPLGLKVEEVLTCNRLEVVTCMIERRSGKLIFWVTCTARKLIHIVCQGSTSNSPCL